jgi:hypothetical protein
MGGCQSSDDAEIPKLPPSILENKFKTIEKRAFVLPVELNPKLEPISSNGNYALIQGKSPISSQKIPPLLCSHTSKPT